MSKFNNEWYNPGRNAVVRFLWYVINAVVFNSYVIPFSGIKSSMLKLFGAKVGNNCTIKPKVNIKYPWKLSLGNNVWIGEKVWIDNLDKVEIGNNVCISQGALLLSGNHDYKKEAFDLLVSPIKIEDGVWIGAKSVVTQGVIAHEGAILSVGSVASQNLDAYSIYKGNPAKMIRIREIV